MVIKKVIRLFLVHIAAIWVLSVYTGMVQLTFGLTSLLVFALGLTLFHLLIKPVLRIFFGMLSFLTFGLLDLAIDAGIFFLVTKFTAYVAITAWNFPGATYFGFVLPATSVSFILAIFLSAFILNIIRSIALLLVE